MSELTVMVGQNRLGLHLVHTNVCFAHLFTTNALFNTVVGNSACQITKKLRFSQSS